MRTVWILLLIVVAISGPYRYLTTGAAARDARYERLATVREEAAGVRALLGDDAPPPTHLIETRRKALDAVDERVREFGRSLERGAAPGVETLRAAGAAAGVADPLLAPLLATIDRGTHAPLRRRALAAVLRALEAAGRPTVESLDVAAAPSTRPEAPPLTLWSVGLTAIGPPTSLVALAEALAAGSADSPPGDLIEARLERTDAGDWDEIGVGPDAPPIRLTLRVELLLGGG